MNNPYSYEPAMEAPNFRLDPKKGDVHAGVWAVYFWNYELFGRCFEDNRTHPGRHVITSDAVTCENCKKRLPAAGLSLTGCTREKDLTDLRLQLWGELEVTVSAAARAKVRMMPRSVSAEVVGDIETVQQLIAGAHVGDAGDLRSFMREIAEGIHTLGGDPMAA